MKGGGGGNPVTEISFTPFFSIDVIPLPGEHFGTVTAVHGLYYEKSTERNNIENFTIRIIFFVVSV